MEFDAVDMRIEGAHMRIEGARQMDARDVSVRVDGLDAERTQEVQARVAARLERRWSIRSRAGAAPQRQPGSTKQDVQVPIGPIDVSLLGTHSDRALREDIEGDIRETVVSALPPDGDGDGDGGGGGGGGGGPVPVCICMMDVPGREIPLVRQGGPEPRFPWKTVDGTFTPPPPPWTEPFWIIAVKLDPWNWAALKLENGALRDPPVGPDQVLVGLANRMDWAKEIWACNLCSGRIGSIHQEGPNATPRTMLLSRPSWPSCRENTDTIVFRKPGFFGIWHDVSHFATENFWEAFGGTVATFTWVSD